MPILNSWTGYDTKLPLNGYSTSAVGTDDKGQKLIFIFGGYDSDWNESDKVYEYHVATGQVTLRDERMPYPLAHSASTVVPSAGTASPANGPTSSGSGASFRVLDENAPAIRVLFFGGVNMVPVNYTLEFSPQRGTKGAGFLPGVLSPLLLTH